MLLSFIFQPELGNTGVLLLCLLEMSGFQINESWENFWVPENWVPEKYPQNYSPALNPMECLGDGLVIGSLKGPTSLQKHSHLMQKSNAACLQREEGKGGERGLCFELHISWG